MDWFKNAHLELDTLFISDEVYSEAELLSRAQCSAASFHFLFHQIIKKLKIRDTWEQYQIGLLPSCTECHERSKKLGANFSFGISTVGWFFNIPITHPELICYMRDEFWFYLSGLSQIGKVEFYDMGKPSNWGKDKKATKYAKLQKSMVFSIMRDFMLSDEETLYTHGLGEISVTLPIDKMEEEVFSFYEGVIQAAYKMNYLLYRDYYQKEKQRVKLRK